jgi:hypothetical protein
VLGAGASGRRTGCTCYRDATTLRVLDRLLADAIK